MYDIILAHKMLSFRKGSANPSVSATCYAEETIN